MKFDNRYFNKFKFTEEQINKNFKNALKDINIAKKDKILEVKFSYVYSALIKGGLALLSFYQVKIKSELDKLPKKGSGAIYRTVIRRGINATATNYFALYSITNFTYSSFFTNSSFLCYYKKEEKERYFYSFTNSSVVFRF